MRRNSGFRQRRFNRSDPRVLAQGARQRAVDAEYDVRAVDGRIAAGDIDPVIAVFAVAGDVEVIVNGECFEQRAGSQFAVLLQEFLIENMPDLIGPGSGITVPRETKSVEMR